MAIAPRGRTAWLAAALLACALGAMAWGPLRDPLRPAEARAIFIGRELLAHGPPHCARAGAGTLAELACAETGSAGLAPVAIALADAAGGYRAARLPGALLGLALLLVVARLATAPPAGASALLAAATFAALGLPWPLVASALPQAWSVALLGLSVLLVERPDAHHPRLQLALAAGALALAAVVSYPTALFVPPLALLVLSRHRLSAARLAFLLPLTLALGAYLLVAVLPAWGSLRAELDPIWAAREAAPRFGRMVAWLSMPFLLATFGLFHERGAASAARRLLTAACAFAAPLLSVRAEDQQVATLGALVLLAPAAGLGVERMSQIFSAHGTGRAARPAFVGAVLAVVAVFGLQEVRTFRRGQPDLSPAVALLAGRGSRAMTVVADSDHGSPEYVYRYHLERSGAAARVVALARATDAERQALLASLRPDRVVLDQHHSPRSFERASAQYLGAGYGLAGSWPVTRGAAVESLQLLDREPGAGP